MIKTFNLSWRELALYLQGAHKQLRRCTYAVFQCGNLPYQCSYAFSEGVFPALSLGIDLPVSDCSGTDTHNTA